VIVHDQDVDVGQVDRYVAPMLATLVSEPFYRKTAGCMRRRSTAGASSPTRTARACFVNRFLRPGRGWVLG